MKTFKTALALGLISLANYSFAQTNINQSVTNENGKVRIHVEKEENGKKEVFDKTYNTQNMSNSERQKLIDSVTDSLSASSGKNTKMRIKVDNDRSVVIDDAKGPKGPKGRKNEVIIKKRYNSDSNNPQNDSDNIDEEINIDLDLNGADFDFKDLENDFKDLGRTLKFKFDDFGPKMEAWGRDFGPKMEAWGKDFQNKMENGNYNFDLGNSSSKTVKNLSAYPNKPNNGKLNVKFFAPDKATATITVTDLNGKVVGQEKITDFSGDYMGQVDLKGNVKGTVFVTVTQGEDGAVKRIVLE